MDALIMDPQVHNGAPSFAFSMAEGELFAAFYTGKGFRKHLEHIPLREGWLHP